MPDYEATTESLEAAASNGINRVQPPSKEDVKIEGAREFAVTSICQQLVNVLILSHRKSMQGSIREALALQHELHLTSPSPPTSKEAGAGTSRFERRLATLAGTSPVQENEVSKLTLSEPTATVRALVSPKSKRLVRKHFNATRLDVCHRRSRSTKDDKEVAKSLQEVQWDLW